MYQETPENIYKHNKEDKKDNELSIVYSFDENTTDYIPIPMHFHEEIEIIYFQKGNATYRIDFSDYFVDSETIIIINKNSPHSIKGVHTEKTKGYIYLFIH